MTTRAKPPADATPSPGGVALVTLVVGPEEFLAERAVRQVLDTARASRPDAERRRVDCADDGAGPALAEALSPTLFGDAAVIEVLGLDAADEVVGGAILAAMADPPEATWLVLRHPGGVKGKALLTKVRAAGADEVACPPLKGRRDGVDFLARELAAQRRTATREAVATIVDAVGIDTRMLASAAAQLAIDVEADPIDAEAVSRYYGGVAEVTGFQVSDAIWERRTQDALRSLRWSAETGDRSRIGPATVGAVASGLRGLIRYAGAPRGSEADIARAAGVPPWKVKVLRQQLGRWRPDQLAAAVVRLAAADAAVKGGLREGENLDPVQKLLALERLVLAVTAADPDRSDDGRT